jgi:hypothetical protein
MRCCAKFKGKIEALCQCVETFRNSLALESVKLRALAICMKLATNLANTMLEQKVPKITHLVGNTVGIEVTTVDGEVLRTTFLVEIDT